MKNFSSTQRVSVPVAILALVLLGGCQGKSHMAMEKMDKSVMGGHSNMATPMKSGEVGSMAVEEPKPMDEMSMEKSGTPAPMGQAEEMAPAKPTM